MSGPELAVSVIIPVFDRPEMLVRAIRSLQSQTCRDFELIVVDDASSIPHSEAWTLVEHMGGKHLRLSERSGVSAARNEGAREASTKILAFLDSDDEWLPEKLEKQITFHQSQKSCVCSQTNEIWIRNGSWANKKKHHILADGECFQLCLERCAVSPSSVMINRDVFWELGGFDPSYPAVEDYHLWLKLSAQHELRLLDQPLIRKHGGHKDQLSRAIPALDAFRIRAILSILETQELSELQQDLALQEARRKAAILSSGSKNRSSGHYEWMKKLESELASASPGDSVSLPVRDSLEKFCNELGDIHRAAHKEKSKRPEGEGEF